MSKKHKAEYPFYTRPWFWLLAILGVGIVAGLVDTIPSGFFKNRILPVLPVLLLLACFLWNQFHRKPVVSARAYRENVIGFIAALSVAGHCPGVYLGDVYHMVDQELSHQRKMSDPLHAYPVFALEVLENYAVKNELPTLMDFCNSIMHDAERLHVNYDLDPTGPQPFT
ncbi:MAG: hypothetical protein IKG89_04795 [Oscillospiraceae bacterium]|nr:hypothetical protein [Oscillospiraceae bacterium]